MRAIIYDKPIKDTYEIIWEWSKDIFIEKIIPYEGKNYFQSHYLDEKIKSDSLGNAMIQMGVLLLKNE